MKTMSTILTCALLLLVQLLVIGLRRAGALPGEHLSYPGISRKISIDKFSNSSDVTWGEDSNQKLR
jgi:hypothetical protein